MNYIDTWFKTSTRWIFPMILGSVLISAIGILTTEISHASDHDQYIAPATLAVAEEDGQSDPEANLPFLFTAYLIIWAGFFAYAFFISWRQKDIKKEIEALRVAITRDKNNSGQT